MRSIPVIGRRYWAALCLASIFGCNLGDFFAADLRLGHWRGLPVLAAALTLTLLAERRARRPNELWYWLAIVVIRTAATNLADLAVHDLRLPYPWAMIGLASLLAALVATGPGGDDAERLPAANGRFWAAMLAAGTLGTAAGDFLAFHEGLGVVLASATMTLLLVTALTLRAVAARLPVVTFWVAVLVIRSWGTNVGDLLADEMGLALATASSGAALLGLLLVRHRRAALSLALPR